ncbi:hypothetical protein GIB67_036127 [Kingdonia uniflora]|uniref:FAD-binding domain-containing protein n=1 Tax=Kingdonia uniflora TaxID=39325 RepID=A0A7J7LAQ7_9MAGN|nr:hypothetical protein GIB67_014566 [Kingdonia uniflora]KAF6163666.1 hypothetical protein GIB67_036126 [Kingdonia uniflora]KAF6163667.1 hypothetical protein GIB67_036127 [Kingdonia uniflora]
MEMKEDVVIIGAGIAGLATAIALKRVGVRALVLEKTHELRTTGASLSLFPNAWSALDTLGVSKKLNALYTPYKSTFVTDVSSGAVQEVSFTGSDGTKAGPRGVHRKILLETLAGELPTGTIRFSIKINSIKTHTDGGSSAAILYLDDGTIINAKVLIGCDGVHSMVAQWLGLSAPVDSGRGAVRGLSMFPRDHGLGNEIQQFLHEGRRAGFAPLNDTEFYWFITHNTSPNEDEEMKSGDPKLIQKNVIESFANLPAVFLDVVQHSDLSTLTWAPLMFRVPWNLIFGKLSKGNITVAGDAMHPMTPDLGQGGAAALEDAVVLGRHIGNSFHEHGQIVSGEVTKALELYVKERKWRCAGLILGSYLSGRVQQGGSRWYTKYLRDTIFYKFLYRRFMDLIAYDCGTLPQSSSSVDNKAD